MSARNSKDRKWSRQMGALERLRDNIEDNRETFDLLEKHLPTCSGIKHHNAVREMLQLNEKLLQLEEQEAGLRRNLGMRQTMSRYCDVPSYSDIEEECSA